MTSSKMKAPITKFRLLAYGENGGFKLLPSAESTKSDHAPGLLVEVTSAEYNVTVPALPALMSSCDTSSG